MMPRYRRCPAGYPQEDIQRFQFGQYPSIMVCHIFELTFNADRVRVMYKEIQGYYQQGVSKVTVTGG
jgi:hypothetical protein